MMARVCFLIGFLLCSNCLLFSNSLLGQTVRENIPYVEPNHVRQILDVYPQPEGSKRPVIFWIHGGGWQVGDKKDVALKPKWFTDKGFVFVSTNYRLLPDVPMRELIGDVASALGWTHKNIEKFGGDPDKIFVMGHSAGAQLAAIVCTDQRYLQKVGVPFTSLRGCVPVDGDTYDIPAMIMTAEMRQTLHGLPLPENGHRVKFGNDPKLHIDFSAVTHVARDKSIPPFLILYVAGHPDVTAQAKRLEKCLTDADVPVSSFGARDTNHSKLNDDLGLENDPATAKLSDFLDSYSGKKEKEE
jgi:acetyl esterase/lipase